MAKALVGGMRRTNIGPNIMHTAARAGVLVDRRREAASGSKYMKGLGAWILQQEVHAPVPHDPGTEQGFAEEFEETPLDIETVAGRVMAELVELDLDIETEEVVSA